MSYVILPYSEGQAKKLGVIIKPSTVKAKKIDVFDKNGKKLASIGALGMNDYPYWIKKMGKDFADKRRKAYKQRHESDRHIKGTPGYFADQILW